MRVNSVGGMVGAAVIFFMVSLCSSGSVEDLRSEARELQEGGKYEDAIGLYHRVIFEHPDDPFLKANCLYEIGLCYNSLGDKGRASHAAFQLSKTLLEMDKLLPEMNTFVSKQLDDNADARASEFVEKLGSIVIPSIDFKNTAVDEAVKKLSDVAAENDRSKSGVKGVAMILDRSCAEDVAPDEVTAMSPVSLSARNITLIDAVEAVARAGNVDFQLGHSVVVFSPKLKMISRIYKMQPRIQEVIFDQEDDDLFYRGVEDAREFLIACGVSFPPRAYARYIPLVARLVVRNTRRNIEKIDKLVHVCDMLPKEMEVSVLFLEVDVPGLKGSSLESLFKPGSGRGNKILSRNQLDHIYAAVEKNKGVRLLSAPRIVTKSGMNAEIKCAEELIYPTDYTTASGAEGTNTTGDAESVVFPCAFETRDVGVILNVTPVLNADGVTVDLTMIPRVVKLERWEEYEVNVADSSGRSAGCSVKQPVFLTRYIATSVAIRSGEHMLIGSIASGDDDTSYGELFIVCCVELLDEKGTLLREESEE